MIKRKFYNASLISNSCSDWDTEAKNSMTLHSLINFKVFFFHHIIHYYFFFPSSIHFCAKWIAYSIEHVIGRFRVAVFTVWSWFSTFLNRKGNECLDVTASRKKEKKKGLCTFWSLIFFFILVFKTLAF